MAKRPKKPSSTPKSPPLPPQTLAPKAGGAHPSTPPSLPQVFRFLTISDAADRLGVSTKAIRRWIQARKLFAVRVGRQIRIPIGAFLHFVGGLPPARP